MDNQYRNNIITIIGAILVSLIFFILSLIDKKLITNPYAVSVGVAIVLGMFIYFAIKSSQETRSEVIKQEREINKLEEKLKILKKDLEEKLKIDHRLNKLEVKIFNDKKRPA